MTKHQLLTVLKINGYDENSSDEEIRSVLLNARYSESEIEHALLILRRRDLSNTIRADGLHTVFYTDNHLRPSEISNLLGIDVSLDFGASKGRNKQTDSFTFLEGLLIIVLAIAFAVLGIALYMYINEVGIFHALEILE